MLKFLIRRMTAIPITLLVITALLYAVTMLAPVDTRAQLYLPRRSRAFMPPDQMRNALDRVIREHGLDDPYPIQYFRWASRMIRGEWGWSPILRTDVLDALLVRTPATAELTLYSLLLLIPLGLASGVMAGRKRDSLSDHGFRLVAYVATSIPPFILGLVLLSIFYVGLHWFMPDRLDTVTRLDMRAGSFKTFTGLLTVDGLLNGRSDISFEALRHLALPVVTLSLAHWATLGRITRVAMIEELDKEYIVAARARGLLTRSVIWRHAFLNAAPPALASTALSAASLVTGVFVVEAVFSFPGVSELITRTMSWTPDTAMALGFAVYSVLVVLLVMLVMDVIQAIINPRIREEMVGA
jgi:ABC-type dipeptide/oligopeptide/nickel transport system permease component